MLSDDSKRAAYDASGEMPGVGPTRRDGAMRLIANALNALLEAATNPDLQNMLREVDRVIGAALSEMELGITQLQRRQAKLIRTRKRIKAKSGHADSMGPIFDALESQIIAPLAKMQEEKVVFGLARQILAEHEYQVDADPYQNQQNSAQPSNGPRAPSFGSLFGMR